jgi:hypothetical protein
VCQRFVLKIDYPEISRRELPISSESQWHFLRIPFAFQPVVPNKIKRDFAPFPPMAADIEKLHDRLGVDFEVAQSCPAVTHLNDPKLASTQCPRCQWNCLGESKNLLAHTFQFGQICGNFAYPPLVQSFGKREPVHI